MKPEHRKRLDAILQHTEGVIDIVARSTVRELLIILEDLQSENARLRDENTGLRESLARCVEAMRLHDDAPEENGCIMRFRAVSDVARTTLAKAKETTP